MVWSKTDDKLHSHHKAMRALKGHAEKRRDTAPLGLWVLAQSYVGDNLTDGYLPLDEIGRWDDDAAELAARLVDAGLWHPAARLHDGKVLVLAACGSPGCGRGLERAEPADPRVDRLSDPGWIFHDWKQWNPLRAEVEAEALRKRIRAELYRDKELVAAIQERDGDRCRYCARLVDWRDRRSAKSATYDHVIPISKGGGNTADNVVTACRECNERKGDRTLKQAKMTLLPPGSLGPLDTQQVRTRYATRSASRSAGVPGSGSGSGSGSGARNVPSTGREPDYKGTAAEPEQDAR